MSITEIRKQLPHGACKEIAKRTKLSVCTIHDVLSGKRKSAKETLILNAIADYLTEIKAQERAALDKLNAALSE